MASPPKTPSKAPSKTPPKSRLIRSEADARANYHHMAEALRALERDLRRPMGETGLIPPEWHKIAQHRGPGPKVKLTLWVEEDVLRFFRSMGQGHTGRMAEVLKTFMLARLAGVVKGAEAVDYAPEVAEDNERPVARTMKAVRQYIAARDAKLGISSEPRPDPMTFDDRLAAIKAEHKERMERKKRFAARVQR